MRIRSLRLPSRNFWLQAHTVLALAAGLLYVVLGLSGSLSVYREELDVLLGPSFSLEDEPSRHMLSLEQIMRAVEQAHPKRYAPWTLELPNRADWPVTAWYARPEETADRYYAPLMVSVNPYTGEVLASRIWGETVSSWLADLHTQLLAGRGGRNLVGLLGLLLMLSAASGLYLWWPGLGGLKQAFRLRRAQGLMRLALDLHRGIGLLAAAWLLLMAATGFNLAFPELAEGVIGDTAMAHGIEGREVRSTAVPNDHPVSLSEAVVIARGLFPHAQVRRITQPAGETGSYRVNLRQRDEINQRHPFTTVWVDRWSGQILDVRNPNQFSAGQSFLAWLWPLHTGEAYGGGGRLAWFFAGGIPLLLYVTGLLRWLYRRGWIADRPTNWPEASWRGAGALRAMAIRLGPIAQATALRLRAGLIALLLALQHRLERLAAGLQRKGR